jgi:glycosyltransferase involved in cell wall biosynthesis
MPRNNSKKPTICIVTCYRQPDYLRAATLRQGLKDSQVFSEVTVIKNHHTNVLRCLDVLADLVKVRFTKNPDAYLITFRGYELLPLILMVGVGKKILYDEFINPVEWFVHEHKHLVGPLSFLGYLLRIFYSKMMKRTLAVIADTDSHAGYSARLMSLPTSKYFVIPVGADESMFKPLPAPAKKPFRVLYYGNMLPLHGIGYVLDAAVKLESNGNIEFHIVGGKYEVAEAVKEAQSKGARIHYDSWVEYSKLPGVFKKSNVCLGGPFGNTVQAQYVVTGKTYQFLASTRATIVGENQETKLFTDKKDTLIIPQADSDALVRVIEWAYAHPNELQIIAENGRKLYERSFSSEQIASDLRRLFTTKHIF